MKLKVTKALAFEIDPDKKLRLPNTGRHLLLVAGAARQFGRHIEGAQH
jgi:hypothetical protein